jgi:hypothetical protein
MQGTEPNASRVGVRDFDWSLNAIKRAFSLVSWLRSVPGGTRLAQFPRPSEWQPDHAFVHGPTALLPTSRPPQPVVVPPYPAPGGNGHYHRERIHSPNQSSGWMITRPPCLGRFLIGYQRPKDRSLECRHSVQPYLSRREIIMALVSSGVTTRPVDSYADAFERDGWWTPRWLRRRRREDELSRWASELVWQWCDTMEGTHLAHATRTAAGIHHIVAPRVRSVDPGPPVTLSVSMLPGQLVEDFQAESHRIAEGMGVPMVRIAPWDAGWIKVFLLVSEPLSAAMPVPA